MRKSDKLRAEIHWNDWQWTTFTGVRDLWDALGTRFERAFCLLDATEGVALRTAIERNAQCTEAWLIDKNAMLVVELDTFVSGFDGNRWWSPTEIDAYGRAFNRTHCWLGTWEAAMTGNEDLLSYKTSKERAFIRLKARDMLLEGRINDARELLAGLEGHDVRAVFASVGIPLPAYRTCHAR